MKASNTQLALAIAAALASTSALAATDTEKLQQQLDELQKEVDSMKGNKAFNLEFGGRLQVDYNHFDGAYNAGPNRSGEDASDFFVRRARLYVESEHGDWDNKLLLDFADNSGEIVMARLRYSGFGNGLKVQVGKLREDISLNALTSSKHITTIERSSLADNVSPYFQWGTSVYQYFKDTGLRYAVGVYKNEAFGANGNNNDDGSLALSLTGRLTWQKDLDNGVLHLGSWYSKRDMGGRVLTGALARGEVRSTNTRLLNYAAGGELVRLNSFEQMGFEAAYQNKGFSVEAEYATRELDTLDSASVLDGERFDAYSLTASYFLDGSQRSYSKGSAVFSQPKGIKNAWELVARLSAADATSDFQGTEVTTYTAGANYYYSANVKFMANVIYSEVDGPGANDLVGDEDDGLGLAARIQYLF